MGAENGPSMESINGFNGQLLSRGFDLSEKFNKADVVGDNKDENERDKANERAREILNSSFVVGKVAETQIEPVITFESVNHMIEIANDDKKTEAVRQRAKDALFETGLALSLDKKVFRAATEGGLEEIIPSNLHGIEPYILSSYLTLGKDDKAGQQLVEKLTGVFRLKKRADKDPGYFGKDFEEKAKQLVGELLDRCDEASAEDQNNGNVGRWETMIGYVKGVDDRTGRSPVVTDGSNQKDVVPEDGIPVLSESDEKKYIAQEQDRLRNIQKEKNLDAGIDDDYHTPSWLVSYEDKVDEEMAMRGKRQIRDDLPDPEYYKGMSVREQQFQRFRNTLLNGVAWKQRIRNRDVEKLMSNESIDINQSELKLLFEMPHFQEAISRLFQDLFEISNEPGESRNLLRLKRKRTKNEDGTITVSKRDLDPRVVDIITHFGDYKEKLALKMQFPKGKHERHDDYEERIEAMYKDKDFFQGKEVEKLVRLRDGKLVKRVVFDGGNKHNEGLEYRAAVGVMWEFLYIGNLLESADVDRLLKPSEPISDKLRSMMHPLAKAMGKWGIYKGDDEGHKGRVLGKDEKKGKYDIMTGEEEPFGGPIAAWVTYHLEMDEVRGLKYEDSFRKKLLDRKNGYRPLPTRMATSLVEMLEVPIEDNNGNLVVSNKGKKIGGMFLSEAIMSGAKITFDVVRTEDGVYMTKAQAEREGKRIVVHEFDGNEQDVTQPFKDCMDGCKMAFDALTGKLKYDPKDPTAWSLAFMKDIDLVRQNAVKYGNDGDKSYLRFVNNPEFIAWVVASSVGMEHRTENIILDIRKLGISSFIGYYSTVLDVVGLPGLTKLGMDLEKIMEYLSIRGNGSRGPSATERYIRSTLKTLLKNEKIRRKKHYLVEENHDDGDF